MSMNRSAETIRTGRRGKKEGEDTGQSAQDRGAAPGRAVPYRRGPRSRSQEERMAKNSPKLTEAQTCSPEQEPQEEDPTVL